MRRPDIIPKIDIFSTRDKIDTLVFQPRVIHSQEILELKKTLDTSKYNQIKGKNMTCHFKKNELYRIDVNGNGQTVYYPREDDGIIGANKAECSDLIIFLKDGKVNSISFLKKPDAILYPIETAPVNYIEGFQWPVNRAVSRMIYQK
jgi:hypothetical protein